MKSSDIAERWMTFAPDFQSVEFDLDDLAVFYEAQEAAEQEYSDEEE